LHAGLGYLDSLMACGARSGRTASVGVSAFLFGKVGKHFVSSSRPFLFKFFGFRFANHRIDACADGIRIAAEFTDPASSEAHGSRKFLWTNGHDSNHSRE
jgi:hypothetical protein